jgi:hypothetical protein
VGEAGGLAGMAGGACTCAMQRGHTNAFVNINIVLIDFSYMILTFKTGVSLLAERKIYDYLGGQRGCC